MLDGASPHTRGWTRDDRDLAPHVLGFPAHAGMDPPGHGAADRPVRLPRTRGDGPRTRRASCLLATASPHTRGWTLPAHRARHGGGGFPAHAGMDPAARTRRAGARRLPRTRGDGPIREPQAAQSLVASPHTRGWTPLGRTGSAYSVGFPAHAGMDPAGRCRAAGRSRLPRTRGDGPGWGCKCRVRQVASPHTRGWTRPGGRGAGGLRGFPAHAGMDPSTPRRCASAAWLPRTRGDGPGRVPHPRPLVEASPHTRGWTLTGGGAARCDPGFPAHAGMDLGHLTRAINDLGLPRTRGDGPSSAASSAGGPRASPHTRGWTLRHGGPPRTRTGFPAHAGMDPGPRTWGSPGRRLPRTRGDGPVPMPTIGMSIPASPHTRGWTRGFRAACRPGSGFPAHAGMDPGSCRDWPASVRLPRTRGDGPGVAATSAPGVWASPHTRGWTRPPPPRHAAALGFPAHAGMDPPSRASSPTCARLPRTRGDGP